MPSYVCTNEFQLVVPLCRDWTRRFLELGIYLSMYLTIVYQSLSRKNWTLRLHLDGFHQDTTCVVNYVQAITWKTCNVSLIAFLDWVKYTHYSRLVLIMKRKSWWSSWFIILHKSTTSSRHEFQWTISTQLGFFLWCSVISSQFLPTYMCNQGVIGGNLDLSSLIFFVNYRFCEGF